MCTINLRSGWLLALMLAAVSGCASLDESDCSNPDWYTIGFEDGAAGYSSDRIEAHSAACRGSGEEPDREAWRAGREDGLTHFCSPAGGIAEGSRGKIRSNVCPPELQEGFSEGYRLGREIHDTNEAMDRIEREISALRARGTSGGLLGAAVGGDNEAQIRQLQQEYDSLARDLRMLELRADRLARE